MKHTTETTKALAELQTLLDQSAATAGPAIATSVGAPNRQMTAEQLVRFWEDVGLVAMTTVSPSGKPHSAPVHARLCATKLSLVIYDNTVRRRDIAANPDVSFVTWGGRGEALIMYGRAREVPDSLRPARDSREGATRSVVEIEVELTRVYAMRGRD